MGWKDAPVVESSPAWASAPEVDAPTGKGFLRTIGEPINNLSLGVIRGVRDAVDTGAEALASGYDKLRGPSLNTLVSGGEAQRVKGINTRDLAQYDKCCGGCWSIWRAGWHNAAIWRGACQRRRGHPIHCQERTGVYSGAADGWNDYGDKPYHDGGEGWRYGGSRWCRGDCRRRKCWRHQSR
jgi:hypothetical protein